MKLKLLIKKLASLPMHPFLIAAWMVLAFLWDVHTSVLPEEAYSTLFIFEAGTALILLFYLLCIRNVQKAALACSATVTLFTCFRAFELALNWVFSTIMGKPLESWIILLAYGLVTSAIVYFILQPEWRFGKSIVLIKHEEMGQALNIVALAAVVFNLIPLVFFENQLSAESGKVIKQCKENIVNINFNKSAYKPDVYFILLDAFANTRTLKEFWGYDNRPFIDFLKNKGFYVVPKAASNYDRTSLSVPASLNLQYLDKVLQFTQTNIDYTNVYDRLTQNNCCQELFKRLGYQCITMNSDGRVKGDSLDIPYRTIDNFTTAVLFLTPFGASEKYFPLLRNATIAARLRVNKYLPTIINARGPKFVYIHSLICHSPYVFDENGGHLPLSSELQREYGSPAVYVSQLKFAQKQAMQWINTIFDRYERNNKPIVIVQSDHGPQFKSNDYFNERMRILNAYYFPNLKKNSLYESVTPINGFRILFNDYFGTQFPILPDNSYCILSPEQDGRWFNTTKKLRF